MSARFWVRFYSPSDDPRPVKIPAPCQWWCSGTNGDGSESIICALALGPNEERIWERLREWWPGLKPSFAQRIESKDWRPGDRFPWSEPSDNGYREVPL